MTKQTLNKTFTAVQLIAVMAMYSFPGLQVANAATENEVNRPPVAVDDSARTRTNTSVSISVLENDTDPDGDDLDLASVNAPSGGSIGKYDVETGEITYNAPAKEGTYYFDYTVTDGRLTDVATVTVIVRGDASPTNQPPVANDDSAAARVNQSIQISVLKNDTDPDGDDLDLAAVNAPSGGTIGKYDVETGEITYNAPAKAGTYRFDYTATDGRLTDVATVTIVVRDNTPGDTCPANLMALDDNYALRVNNSISFNVMLNDQPEEAVFKTAGAPNNPKLGDLNHKGNGNFTFEAHNPGTLTFDYTIGCPGSRAIDSARVTIVIQGDDSPTNQPPVANDDSATARVNQSIQISVLNNDTDPDGDDLDLASVNAPSGGTIGKYDVETGEITYNAPATAGTYYFDYTATDGRLTDVATVTIVVQGDNPPTSTGTLRVCKLLYDENGNITDGTKVAGTRFNIPVSPLNAAVTTFDTPLDLNTVLFTTGADNLSGSEGIAAPKGQAECITYRNIPLNKLITYSQERIIDTGAGDVNWAAPRYNDDFTYGRSGSERVGFFPWGSTQNADGEIILTAERPDRTFVILNQYQDVKPPVGKGTVRVCKMIADEAGNISNGSPVVDEFAILVDGLEEDSLASRIKSAFGGKTNVRFTSPLNLNANVLQSPEIDHGPDAECQIYTVDLGTTIKYDRELIETVEAGQTGTWGTPRYYDESNGYEPTSLSQFKTYGSADTADGVTTVTAANPYVTITVLNTLKSDDPEPGSCVIDLSASRYRLPADSPLTLMWETKGDTVAGATVRIGSQDDTRPVFNFTTPDLRGDKTGTAASRPGSYTYKAAVRCADGTLATDTIEVQVVKKGEQCPAIDFMANDDNYSVRVGNEITFNVLDNDEPAQAVLVRIGQPNDPSLGNLTRPPLSTTAINGLFKFEALKKGTYTFDYSIGCPGGQPKDTATVTITITDGGGGGGSCPAVDAANDSYRISKNQMTALNVLSNDSTGPKGEPLEIDAITSKPSNANVSIVNDRIQFTPESGFEGTTTFTYRAINDCGKVDSATVTVTVGGDNGGGGGGGGGGILDPHDSDDDDDGEVLGDDEINLDIFNERLTRLSDSKYVVTWNTNIPATSQVVYGMRSVSNPSGSCGSDLGYQQRTNIKTNLTTTHVMIIDGLTPGAQYYFRPVSDRSDTDCEHGRELTDRPVKTCEGYIKDFMKIGQYNDPREVAKLQAFLRIYEGANITINGTFDVATDRAVKDFQLKYYEHVLQPWGYNRNEATGYVYITTRNKINEIICERDIPFTSAQLTEIAAFRNYWTNRFGGEVKGVATQPLDRNYEKAAGYEALLPKDDDSKVSSNDDGEVVVLGNSEDIVGDTISDDEFFLDSVVDGENEVSAEREMANKSVAGAAAAGIISFIFSLPFLLTVLGVLILMLIYEIIKDRKSKENQAEATTVVKEPAVPNPNN